MNRCFAIAFDLANAIPPEPVPAFDDNSLIAGMVEAATTKISITGRDMISILLVSSHVNFLSGFESIDGKRADIEISRTGSGQEALECISKQPFHLAVVDEALSDMAGLALVEKIVLTHPMINCAAASRLAGHEFHEASEGLGILMQLPLEPTEGHVKDLLDRLEQILKLNRSGARIP